MPGAQSRLTAVQIDAVPMSALNAIIEHMFECEDFSP